MKEKTIKRISNLFFFLAFIIGGYAVIRTIINYANVPPGACPISSYREYMVIAVIFAVISMILDWKSRKMKEE